MSSKKSPIQMTSLLKGVVYLGHLGLLRFFPPQKWMDFALGFNQNVAFFIPSFQIHHNKMGFLKLLIY